MARYFVHLPPDGSPAVFWRGLAGFARQLIQINLNLLAHAVGDDPASLVPPGGTLVAPRNYAYGNRTGENLNLQPFAFTPAGGNPNRPQALPAGPLLTDFLNDPLEGERMDLSLPFYDEGMELGPTGGGWFRDNNDDSAFHAATDFNVSPRATFDVCAAAEGEVVAVGGGHIVLGHRTAGGRDFRTTYTHLDRATVSKAAGDPVRRGEFLGRTDPAESPIHLHFGVAVLGPARNRGGINIPALWYFIDPWGVYDLRANNYLPGSGRIWEAPIAGRAHTAQWRAQPLVKCFPIARLTDSYQLTERIQVRVRRGDNRGGTFPPEHEQFLVWLEGDPDFFLVPLAQAGDRTAELELIASLRDAHFHRRKVRLEYRYAGEDRYVMAAWIGK